MSFSELIIPINYSESWGKPIRLKNLTTNTYHDFTGYNVVLSVTDDRYRDIVDVDGDVAIDGSSVSFPLDLVTFWEALGTKAQVDKKGHPKCEIVYTIGSVRKVISNITLKISI